MAMRVQTRRDFLGHHKSSMFNLDNGSTDCKRVRAWARACVLFKHKNILINQAITRRISIQSLQTLARRVPSSTLNF